MKTGETFFESYSCFAAVYDFLMRDVDYDAWAAYLDRLLKKRMPQASMPQTSAPALVDCACGTGALSIQLHKLGYRVTGVDRSEDMLRVAQQNARAAGAAIPFVRQDMRALELHQQVDVVCCACDGVNYLLEDADARAFFCAAHAALKPGGALLFDVSAAYKLAQVLGDGVFAEAEAPCAYIWRNQYFPGKRLSRMELTCFVQEQGGAYRRFDELHVQRAYTAQELTDALHAAGFAAVEVLAAFTEDAPADDTERLQIFALRT